MVLIVDEVWNGESNGKLNIYLKKEIKLNSTLCYYLKLNYNFIPNYKLFLNVPKSISIRKSECLCLNMAHDDSAPTNRK